MLDITFAPTPTNIEVVQGDTFEIAIPITDEDGAGADLSAFTAATEVDQPAGDDVVAATVIEGSNVVVSMTAAQTAVLEDGSRITTTIRNSDDSIVQSVIYGRIFVLSRDALQAA